MLQTFENYKEHLNFFLTSEDVLNISFYCEKEYYTTILKQYGVVVLQILIKHYEGLENYEVCKDLKDTIKNHNKNFGTNYKLQLW